MPKFIMTERILDTEVVQARIGSGTKTASAANIYDDKEVGKFVKLAGESRYVLCAVGDEIEGRVSSIEVGTYDDFSFGGVAITRYMAVTFDGAQATPGTGNVAIGNYVRCGTVVAKGTALTAPARVVAGTDQAASKATPFAWRVVSLGAAGTGAPGTVGLIERVGH